MRGGDWPVRSRMYFLGEIKRRAHNARFENGRARCHFERAFSTQHRRCRLTCNARSTLTRGNLYGTIRRDNKLPAIICRRWHRRDRRRISGHRSARNQIALFSLVIGIRHQALRAVFKINQRDTFRNKMETGGIMKFADLPAADAKA